MPAPMTDGLTVYIAHSGGGSAPFPVFSTTQSNDIVVVVSSCEGNTVATPDVTSVTGAGLTFARRSTIAHPTSGGTKVEVWWAVAAAPLTNVLITINYSGTYDDTEGILFGVKGCNVAAPWDGAASLPKYWTRAGANQAPTFTGVSTTQANDLILMALGAPSNMTSYVEAAGFTMIGDALNSAGVRFAWAHASGMGVTSPQSGVTYTGGTLFSSDASGSVDALTADAVAAGGGAKSAILLVGL